MQQTTSTKESIGLPGMKNQKTYSRELSGNCVECGAEVHTEVPIMLLSIVEPQPMLCSECGQERARQREEQQRIELEQQREQMHLSWIRQAIPRHYQQKRFDEFIPGKLFKGALDRCKRYAKMVMKLGFTKCPSLLLASEGKGTGKTHLAAAIGLDIIDNMMRQYPNVIPVCPIMFTTASELFLRIRATYREDAEDTEADIVRRIERVPLLILDDVGKEKPSEHTRNTYYTIFNCRYNADRPMVITSNLLLGKHNNALEALMGDATLSRLKEMTDGWRIDMSGPDYRFQKKENEL